MLTVLTDKDSACWNDTVKSFKQWDIYYTYEYVHSFKLHGDGEPLLFLYEKDDSKICYVVMKSDIGDSPLFSGLLERGKFYDLETPYGYGGPIAEGEISSSILDDFKEEICKYCRQNNIISQFVRFHPLLMNWKIAENLIESRYLRDTIYIDTSSEDIIWSNFDTKNRNMVRKAVKSGVTVEMKSIEEYEEFIPIYNSTMKLHDADEYYIFGKEYYEYLKTMGEDAKLFYAYCEGKPISASIMLFSDKYMHYHLSGTYPEYRNLAASNLLLYEAAKEALSRGINRFHLGGGLSPDDSLFGFKKQFNKNGRAPFVVGRTIFDEKSYEELLRIREEKDSSFDRNNSRMIAYRCP